MELSQFAKEQPSLPSDSDESDEDYAPSGAESSSDDGSDAQAAVSGEGSASEGEGRPPGKRTHSKRPPATSKRRKKSAHRGARQETDAKGEASARASAPDSTPVSEEEQKKKADTLWQDFKSGPSETQASRALTNGAQQAAGPSTVTVTQVYKFAGEEVSVQKEVAARSAGRGRARGLASVLGQLGRKSKMGTLEKSRLDWDRFKQQEGIVEDIQTFNRGKDGGWRFANCQNIERKVPGATGLSAEDGRAAV
ncbi:craniofacial development protein 1 isoform X2 [Bacillus rossius redtenbacheri]|uniref:craniofacial development protein 1 isoform X2 n=1 Tax=Bacillus rossius redtenbacheri TaxID=93214 RepID=UPI002FDD3059